MLECYHPKLRWWTWYPLYQGKLNMFASQMIIYSIWLPSLNLVLEHLNQTRSVLIGSCILSDQFFKLLFSWCCHSVYNQLLPPFYSVSLLNVCSLKNQEHLLKLTVSTMDYSRDGLARVILSKILTAATDVRVNTALLTAAFSGVITCINSLCNWLASFNYHSLSPVCIKSFSRR